MALLLGAFFAPNGLAASGNQNQEKTPSFHSAETDQEKALEAILRYNESNNGVLADLRGGVPVDPAKQAQVEAMFTAEVLTSWRNQEQAMLDQNCGGKQREGEICGLDYDPLNCAQDTPESYLYLTEKQDAETAIITVKWGNPPQPSPQATYRLVKRDGVWKLDGVRCTEGGDSNMPN